MADCSYEMGQGGEACAWSPGSCKSWCRANTKSWAPTVLDLMDEFNKGTFIGSGIYIDMLTPKILRLLMTEASMDEHLADMHAENMEALKIDGIFGIGRCRDGHKHDIQRDDLIRKMECSVHVVGLSRADGSTDRTLYPSESTLAMWDSWMSSNDGWIVKGAVLEPDADAHYRISPSNLLQPGEPSERRGGPRTDRHGAVDAIAAMMGDDMQTVRMVASKLFYQLRMETVPWSYERRKGFAAVLNVFAKNIPDVLTPTKTGPSTITWTFLPMGPQTHSYGGGIHLVMKRPPPAAPQEAVWNSAQRCSITIDLSHLELFNPLRIELITSW